MVKKLRSAALMSVALAIITSGQSPPTVKISLIPGTIMAGQPSSLSWSSVGATSCYTGADPYINGWNSTQAVSGEQTATQSSAGTYVYALTCTGSGGKASASATLTVVNPGERTAFSEGVTGLPADITPFLSIAGVWQPVANQYLRSDDNGNLANQFAQNILLPNGREGLIVTGWSCCGATAPTPITPVNIAVLEQQPDGTLEMATSKYVSDPQTNGGGIVLVADLNQDGIQDFFLPAYNESPFLPASSTAYVSKTDGTYEKIVVGDGVESHGGTVANINGTPMVFSMGYGANCNTCGIPNAYAWNGSNGFTITPETGQNGASSTAVGDFYGDGTYSQVYGDFPAGLNLPPSLNYVNGIYLYHLSGVLPVGVPVNVGDPYFNDKPEYQQYVSYTDPHGKTHNYRTWLDDFNHDGKMDIVVQGSIYPGGPNGSLNVLQMFQNIGNYQFSDVTDRLDPQYDIYTEETDYDPQVRDIDKSGINSYLLMSSTDNQFSESASNYVLVNDGSGSLHPALHETLNTFGQQVIAWLISTSSFPQFNILSQRQPDVRAYQTADGKLNFVAIVWIRGSAQQSPQAEQYVFVNIPLKLDLSGQFTKAMVVQNRNGSHLIRTFAGDDTICSGNNGGYSKIDGGLGTNTVIYSGPSQNYSVTQNADGTWTIKDNVGSDGIDTLTRVQRIEFADVAVSLAFLSRSGFAAAVPATPEAIRSAMSTRRSPHPCR